MRTRPVILSFLAAVFLSPVVMVAAEPVDFDQSIAPLLASRCMECHNEIDRKGKLDLGTKAAALRTMDAIITPGDPEDSLLWEQVDGDEMPPKKPLSNAEKALLKTWIKEGAKWGKAEKIDRFAYSTDSHAGADWWSLQPVKRPELPGVKANHWPVNPIDHFVLSKLEAKNLKPAPPADPRVLIRRVTFDLIGLPPTPEEIEAFVKEWEAEKSSELRAASSELKGKDLSTTALNSPTRNSEPATRNFSAAYSRLIDRLLASPHYGERWARHWLDVARYTESQGFEYDRLRPNAWHYRDYVINAFNSDKPYDVFLQEQIAGDAMNFASPGSEVTSDGIIATSLLVCGPWDQAGNAQANVTQRMITREEEMEDLVSVIGQTFLGMTINCARCHSHKFDPITQTDYFRIKAVFDGVRHGERPLTSPQQAKERAEQVASLERTIAQAEKAMNEIEAQARARAQAKLVKGAQPVKAHATAQPVAKWTFDGDVKDAIGTMHGELIGGAAIRDGRLIVNGDKQHLRTAPLKRDISEKTLEAWVVVATLDQRAGGVITIETGNGGNFDSIVFGERQPRKWMAGSTGFMRTKDVSAEPETASNRDLVHMVIAYRADGTIAIYRNGKPYAEPYRQHELQTYKAGDARVVLGIRHTDGGNPYFNGEIDAAALYDRALTSEQIAELFAAGPRSGPVATTEQVLAEMSDAQRKQIEQWREVVRVSRGDLASIPAAGVSYVGLRQQPQPTRRLERGDVNSPAEVVAPGALSIIKSPVSDLSLAPDAPEAQRRIKLAKWLADPQHPLTARVMVNRIWHYHFGRGIVETPNDFGFNGAKPSHPELLDWLAAEFVDGSFEIRVPGSELKSNEPAASATPTRNSELQTRNSSSWSIKRLHKLILLSSTYQQSAAMNEQAAAIDADNAMLWRFAPRRIEGEIIRDAMLAVSGDLNPQMGGPSFKPFTVTNHGSDFYHLKDMVGPQYNRRTIYRAHVNSGKSAMMDALDCPDPSIKTPARRVTTTPLAALALMNNSFVQRQAKQMSLRMLAQTNKDESAAILLAYRTAFGRPPSEQEQKDAAALVKEYDFATLCWALLNATEFMYVN